MKETNETCASPQLETRTLLVNIIDDNEVDARKLQSLLIEVDPDLEVDIFCKIPTASEMLANDQTCLVFVGQSLGNETGTKLIERYRNECPSLPFVLLMEQSDEPIALEALHVGASDFTPYGGKTNHS